MSRKRKIVLALVLVIAAILLSRPLVEFAGRGKPPIAGQSPRDHLGAARAKLMTPERILKIVNPPPGSTILDLGAGYGLFTFSLAEATGPTGKVFASDVDPDAVAYLAKEAAKVAGQNVVPVQVTAKGVDPFYATQTFDVILAADVLVLIDSPQVFFSALRASLKAESGRLWIVDLFTDPDFTRIEFADPEKVVAFLRSDRTPAAVITRRLSPATRQALAGSPEAALAAAIPDFNAMLEDPTLWPEVQAKGLALDSKEAETREHFAGLLEKKGAFAKTGQALDGNTKWQLRFLNRILLTDLLGTDLWEKATKLLELGPEQFATIAESPLRPSRYGSPDILTEAGYTLVQEHKGIPYCRVLELKRAR